MKKFTIFTIILTVIVVVVFSEVIVNEYLPNVFGNETGNDGVGDDGDLKLSLPASLDAKKSISTNVLGSDLGNYLGSDEEDENVENGQKKNVVAPNADAEKIKSTNDKSPIFLDPNAFSNEDGLDENSFKNAIPAEKPVVESTGTSDSEAKDFEDESFVSTTNNVYLRAEQIKSAGFIDAYLENEAFDGRLFKTILIDDLNDAEVTKTLIRNKDALLVKVYIFKIALNANVNEVYELLKLRAAQGLNIRLNETNEFGLASFYMNDLTRSDTAFLTVRIAGFIYSFSYPKAYHSQVKNLMKLIEWEF